MTGSDWNSGYAKALAVSVNGDAITEPGPRGERITDADFVLLINAHDDAVTFSVPPDIGSAGTAWQVIVDTGPSQPIAVAPGQAVAAAGSAALVEVAPRAIVVLRGTKIHT
jgi:glycogen operon protein